MTDIEKIEEEIQITEATINRLDAEPGGLDYQDWKYLMGYINGLKFTLGLLEI